MDHKTQSPPSDHDTFHSPKISNSKSLRVGAVPPLPAGDADFSGGGDQLPLPFPAGSASAATGRRRRPHRVGVGEGQPGDLGGVEDGTPGGRRSVELDEWRRRGGEVVVGSVVGVAGGCVVDEGQQCAGSIFYCVLCMD